MNILVVGGDTQGAWQMRGVQLGKAIGARVTAMPSKRDWSWADLVVLVKRAAMLWHAQTVRLKVPVVWDALDFWDQPKHNSLPVEDLKWQALTIRKNAGATTIICATRAMADDLGGLYLSHHCRLGLTPQPIKAKATSVGYDGQRKYLSRWFKALEKSCAELGLTFVVNPAHVGDVDVLVSFRDGRWDGEVCQRWKSGVKYVNAIVAGRPILSQRCAAQAELSPIGAVIDSPGQLTDALRSLISRDVREGAYEYGQRLHQDFQLSTVARQYAAMLGDIARKKAA